MSNAVSARLGRDYSETLSRVRPGLDRAAAMKHVVDVLWDELHSTGVSWVGFYVHEGADELVLAARRDKPACSPIGLHGACGRSYRDRSPLVVHDVRTLGESYVACDPRDQSEVVLPLLDPSGRCYGVLDLDSHEVGAFDARDVDGLQAVLEKAGLTYAGAIAPPDSAGPVATVSAVERERNMLVFYAAIWIPVIAFILFVLYAC